VIETEWGDKSLRYLQARLASRPAPRPETPRRRMTPRDRRRTARRLGNLAERLVPVADELILLVHGEGDREAIGVFLAGLSAGERDALLVVLAGIADPAVPVEQALEWLTWDENEEALRPDPMAAAGPGYRWRASERRGEGVA
jgi:hypothetical protein